MTPKQIERATYLLKRLEAVRADITSWATVWECSITIAYGNEYMVCDVRPIHLKGNAGKAVLKLALQAIRKTLADVEAELTELGVEYERREMVIDDMVFGASAPAN